MDKLIQPKRDVTTQNPSAFLLNLGGLLLMLLLLGWVLNVAVGAVAIRRFRTLVFENRFMSRRARLPLFKLFTGSDETGVDTTVAGPDENPTYHPHIGNAEWALRREGWNARWRYDVALAYWNESERKQREIDRLQTRLPGMSAAAATLARQRIDKFTQEVAEHRQSSFTNLSRAVGQDPANAFYRETLAELGELLMVDATVRDGLRQTADGSVPGSTYLLILYAERLQRRNRTQEALETYKRALGQLKTEFSSGVADKAGVGFGLRYQARIVKAFEDMLTDYDAWQVYVPDDAEVHLRLARHLRQREISTRDPKYAKMAAAERAKGIQAALDLVDQGKQSSLVLHFLGQAYRDKGDMKQCVKYLKQSSTLRPKYRLWWFVLAKAQWDVARELATEARSVKDAGETGRASNLQDEAREYIEQARESLTNLFELEPSNSEGLELRRTIKDKESLLFE